LLRPYTLFAALEQSDQLSEAVLSYKAVVLDSLIEDRLLADIGKHPTTAEEVVQLTTKRRTMAHLLLQNTEPFSPDIGNRVATLQNDIDNMEATLAGQFEDLGHARRALTESRYVLTQTRFLHKVRIVA
jgi:hypothetical protein